jgi:DNA (cytosine-5)-methyltransferase 1
MRFIDLFAGLGGFHQALTELGHECVFASEKKEHLAKLYELNYGIEVNRNIRNVSPTLIPDHDILCAGFPCQPFSKAGNQEGLGDKRNGSFFDIIVEILKHKRPNYFILENVRNLETHDGFKTWNYIFEKLGELGYHFQKKVLSPHEYNIPQHRERLFIVGSLEDLEYFNWPMKVPLTYTVKDYINTDQRNTIEQDRLEALNVWQEFIDALPKTQNIPGFPIWSMEFGADYPIDRPISTLSNDELNKYKGNFGVPLSTFSYEEKLKNLPGYAVKNKGRAEYPDWKQRWILANRNLYLANKKNLDPVLSKISQFPNKSWQKFEWNCGAAPRNLKNYIIQFRASGVRIKKADFFPSLVTLASQIPIVGWENRYITPLEGAKIQSFTEIKLPENLGACFGALGNAVNVKLVSLIAERLFSRVEGEEQNVNLLQHAL